MLHEILRGGGLAQLAVALGYNQPRGGVTSQVLAVEQTHGTIVGAPLATGTEWFEIGEEQDGEGEQQRGSLKLCEHMRARMDAMHSIIMGRQQFETTMTAAISTMRHDIGGFHEALKNHGSRMEEVSNTLQLMHK